MEKQSSKAAGNKGKTTHWRRLRTVTALVCAMAQLPAALAQEPARGEAVLNFVGAEIESVVKAVGHYTNTTFLIDPRVKGTVNLISEKPVSKSEALNLLGSALRLQGYAIVIGDGFAKVVPEADAKLQAGPIQVAPGTVRGDQIATQIFRLNYESAANLVTVLRPLISPNNTINANPGTNSLVITDYADNLRRMGKIIAALDAPASGEMDVIPVRHAIASDIATMVNKLMEPAPGAGVGDRTSVLADPRTNSLILRAPSPARANLAKSLVAKLDQPTTIPGNVHVVHLRNADAVKLAQTLRAVISADASASQPAQAPAAAQAPTAAGQQGAGGGMASGPLGGGAAQAQNNLPAGGTAGFIQADAATNTLIITASDAVYRNLRAVIDKLDARRAQVYIESLIVEVTADRAAEFGVQWAGLSGDAGSRYRVGTLTGFGTGGRNLINLASGLAGGAATAPTLPANGLNLGVFRQIGGELTLGAVARALEEDGNTNILSMPNLITLDNEEARIIVGQNVPFVTGQFTTPVSAGAAAAVNPFQTIERKDVGLSLRVRPQISEGGVVKLAIYQENSNVLPTSSAADIITRKRSIETNVLVDDGGIIVLGGLIEDAATNNDEKVPALGDIPLVGNLFKYQRRERRKTNLMVFLRPTVIRTGEQNTNVAIDRYDYIRNSQLNVPAKPHLLLPSGAPTILPELENGRPVGGSMVNVPPAPPEGEPRGVIVPAMRPVPVPAVAPK